MTAIVEFDEPELPFPPAAAPRCQVARSPLAPFDECPCCGGEMHPEHAHFRCSSCGWRDSCCD